MPPQSTQAAKGFATPNASNPYIMRILIDHYEPKGSGTAFSIYQGATGWDPSWWRTYGRSNGYKFFQDHAHVRAGL